jgi:adhesin/invasin
VLVRDAFTNPVPNQSVTFTVSAGGGSVTGATPLTNASGVATIGSWRLSNGGSPSNGAYPNSLTVSSSGTPGTSVSASAVWSFASDVMPIFNNNGAQTCAQAGCHVSGATSPNLSATVTAYNAIRGVNPGIGCGAYVTAALNGAATSFLYNKISTGSPCGGGSRMPAVGGVLSTAQQNIIRDWINNNSPFN